MTQRMVHLLACFDGLLPASSGLPSIPKQRNRFRLPTSKPRWLT